MSLWSINKKEKSTMSYETKPFILIFNMDIKSPNKIPFLDPITCKCKFIEFTTDKKKAPCYELFLRAHKQYTTIFESSSPYNASAYCVKQIKFEDQIPTIGKSLEKTLKEEFLKLQKIVSEYLIDYLATPGTYVRDFSFDDKSGIITNKALIQILFGEDSYKNDGKESKFIVKSLKE